MKGVYDFNEEKNEVETGRFIGVWITGPEY